MLDHILAIPKHVADDLGAIIPKVAGSFFCHISFGECEVETRRFRVPRGKSLHYTAEGWGNWKSREFPSGPRR